MLFHFFHCFWTFDSTVRGAGGFCICRATVLCLGSATERRTDNERFVGSPHLIALRQSCSSSAQNRNNSSKRISIGAITHTMFRIAMRCRLSATRSDSALPIAKVSHSFRVGFGRRQNDILGELSVTRELSRNGFGDVDTHRGKQIDQPLHGVFLQRIVS